MGKEKADLATTLDGLRRDINALRETFNTWREQVYATGIDKTEREHSTEAETDMGRWAANEQAHQEIIERLDTLNGFRNKIMHTFNAGRSIIDYISPILVFAYRTYELGFNPFF